MNNLKDKVAIVTGSTSGIGKAVAEKLSDQGCNLILLARNWKILDEMEQKLSKKVSVKSIVCDVSQKKQLLAVQEKVKLHFANIDFLVNNVGLSLDGKQGEVEEEKFEELLSVNLKSAYLCTMIFAYPMMKEGGSIVNISSIRARTGTPSFSSGYAAAKAGLFGLSKSFALELAERNIRVNCIAPGMTYPTGMNTTMPVEIREKIAQSIPLKRLATPQNIADGVYFLLSDLSSYITGQTIDINGGAWLG